jgi:molecular chaperone HtpG
MNSQNTSASAVAMTLTHKLAPVTEDVLIGKDVLELLTGAMYNEPLNVYREYVQNAMDAIEDAVSAGQLNSMSEGQLDIWLDHDARTIRIRDNGIGVPNGEFTRRLTAIGGSKKRGVRRRGFRGVGRLSGLGYCQEMIFRSRSAGDARPRELVWNGRRLKEVLRDSLFVGSLDEVIKQVTSTRPLQPDGYPASFFEVELRGVVRVKNDVLMNEDIVRGYLCQVAPVPFDPAFHLGKEILGFLSNSGLSDIARITVHDERGPVNRPHTCTIRMSKAANTTLSALETFSIEGLDGDTVAIGWLIHHDYLGSIPKTAMVGGVRVRAGNIQIGDESLLQQIFPESRFNMWSIGEIHILSPKIVPNGRRDDFESNVHWHDLLAKLQSIGASLAKRCRSNSQSRLTMRRGQQLFERAQRALAVAKTYSKLDFANDFMMVEIDEMVSELRKLAIRQEPNSPAQQMLNGWLETLESPMASLRRTNPNTDVLGFLPKNQRSTFKNALELVLTLSPDPAQASELIERVITHAKRSYA